MPCDPCIDSRMTLEEAIAGTKAPPSVIRRLCLIDVPYLSFDGRRHQGQLVAHESVCGDLLQLFALMEDLGFPVSKAVPLVHYGWSDDASMADNNSSAFNYRWVDGTERLSAHAQGLAVDINPRQNPVFYQDGRISPPGAYYTPGEKGVLTLENPVVRAFLNHGWQWGGLFENVKDYHHFEKRTALP